MMEYFNCDFTGGFPEGVTVEDLDGAPLHFLMIQAGFDQGDSWKVIHDRSAGNYYAASPSMHTVKAGETPVPANDRMTLPPVMIRGGSALMTWRCRAFNDQSSTPSTYSILVGDKVIVDRAEAPASGWISMDTSLEEFAGQRISITFVNNTLNGEVLAIDDVVISGQPGLATVTVQPGNYAIGGESFRIGATFTAGSDIPVTSVGVIAKVNGETLSAKASDLNLLRGESHSVYIDRRFDLEFGTTLDYEVTPVVNGVNLDPIHCSTTPLAFLPHKRVVVEEGTGTWCGWCPIGIVATDSLKMEYDSDVIPIAIHFGGDVMAMDAYASALGISGAPYGKLDRTLETADPMVLVKDGRKECYTIWRGGFGTLAQQRLDVKTMADINADASLSADKKSAEITCNVCFAVDILEGDYRIALVMIEDKVWASNPQYFQSNYLANYPDRAPIGGFENLPTLITSDFEHKHVARAVADNAYSGIKGSLPASFTAGEVHEFTQKMTIPSSVLNPSNVQIVAMLIDGADGSIVNACQVPLDKTSITNIHATDTESIQLAPGAVTVTHSNGLSVSASLYDLSGRVVATASDAAGSVTISAAPGLYIIRTATTSKLISL